MPAPIRLVATAALLSASLMLTACQSSEEKAEAHYQNALTLLQEGDVDRAIVELRNVFHEDGRHREARLKLAELLLQKGNRQQAYSQYLRLAEQYPDDLEVRIALAEIAFSSGRWDEVDRHGQAAEALAPEDPRVKAIGIARAYRDAAADENAPARREAAREAEALLAERPDNALLHVTLLDNAVREQDTDRALAETDWLIAHDPTDIRPYQQRLQILVAQGDMTGAEALLREMVAKFPKNKENKAALIRFYLAQKDLDGAEAFLRELAAAAAPDDPGPMIDLIRFLAELRGPEAARSAIDDAIAERPDPVPFQMIGAALDFEAGRRDQAISTLEAILDGAEPSEQTRNIKVALARMLLATGNEVGARQRVEEVLAEDAAQPEALKMQAAWQIQSDETDAAIAGLRTALDHAPNDSQAMTLMAEAYIRAGRPELANDYLSLAVDASGNAPAETLRYARKLIEDGRLQPAEDILLAALRLAPDNGDLLNSLGRLYLQMKDYGRARHVADTLRRLGDADSVAAADRIETERLNLQRGTDEAISYLEQLAGTADAGLSAKIDLIRARLATGDVDAALAQAEKLRQDHPDDDTVAVILAATYGAQGTLDRAAEIYRDLLRKDPNRPGIWLELSNLQMRQGDRAAAAASIGKGLEQTPDDPRLLWARASMLERDGDIDGAIEIYESLYARNSSSLVVANNLASLLATYRDDAESLDRAWTVARRFRDTKVPAMQDTYGWIALRRGEGAEALPYLEAAARGLPDDPLVHYHLGQAYVALSRPADALEQFRKAVEIAGPADRRPQIEEARAQIESLGTAAPAEN
ncbi:tetratricopeptide repeat protein [Rhodovulum sp. MB263]|uniref:tetratricopeptide repeat protein n=1 Tax=Rhodovulum sp. (strain MB263) TaxID=308754 RepID=UPI001E51AEC6|nr:tetratricopeptide repeat protein [Rhodovulum sp. MB263]